MGLINFSQIRCLDQVLAHSEDFPKLIALLRQVDQCAQAISKHKLNVADILSDPENRKTYLSLIHPDAHCQALEMLLRVSLADYSCHTFVTQTPVQEKKEIEFLYRLLGGWRQFDTVLFFQYPKPCNNFFLVNPLKSDHWKALESVPVNTLVQAYLRTAKGNRQIAQERLGLERIEAVFETVEAQMQIARPAAGVTPITAAKRAKPAHSKAACASKSRRPIGPNDVPCLSFWLMVNKLDTFVHAGNAQLIMEHLQRYSGQVKMYVQRDTKKNVNLDTDSIWSAEIRNGEKVTFEFYGPKPSDPFIQELSQRLNKYTQMDKIANE